MLREDTILRRLWMFSLVPIMALLLIAGAAITYQTSRLTEMTRVLDQANLAVAGGSLVHELQKERGSQVGLLTATDLRPFRDLVDQQRQLTNTALVNLSGYLSQVDQETLSPELSVLIDQAEDKINTLVQTRWMVDGLGLAADQNTEFYTNLIYNLIDMIGVIQKQSPDPELTRQLLAYRSLVLAKEKAGLERAMGSALFNIQQFDPVLWSKYNGLVQKQNAYFRDFEAYSTTEELTAFDQDLPQTVVEAVLTWRSILLDLPLTNDTQGISGAEWFQVTTDRIDQLKQVEDRLAQQIQESAGALITYQQHTLILTVFICFAFIVCVMFATYRGAKGLADPLVKMSNHIKEALNGQVPFETMDIVEGPDEVKRLTLDAVEVLRKEQQMIDMMTAFQQEQMERVQMIDQMLALIEKHGEMSSHYAEDVEEAPALLNEGNEVLQALRAAVDAISDQNLVFVRDNIYCQRVQETINSLRGTEVQLEGLLANLQKVAQGTRYLVLNSALHRSTDDQDQEDRGTTTAEWRRLTYQVVASNKEIEGLLKTILPIISQTIYDMYDIEYVAHVYKRLSAQFETARQFDFAQTQKIEAFSMGNMGPDSEAGKLYAANRNVKDGFDQLQSDVESIQGRLNRLIISKAVGGRV